MKTLLIAFLMLAQGDRQPVQVAPKSSLTLEAVIPMPGVEGRIDHMTFVVSKEALFVAALEHGSVEQVQIRSKRVLPPLEEPREPCAVVYDSEYIYVTDAKGGGVWRLPDQHARGAAKLDAKPTLVEIGPDADNMRILARSRTLLVGYGDGALGWMPLTDFSVKSRAELGGHPESFQVNAAETRAWVNVPSKQMIGVVDLEAKAVVRKIDVKSAQKNYPMALAEKDKRLIIGCREPAKMLVYDIETDLMTAELPLSSDVDDIFVDEARGLVYASCGEGFVDVFERTGPGAWKPKEKIATSAGARTCLFVASTKKLFVAVPHRGEQQAEVRVFSTAP